MEADRTHRRANTVAQALPIVTSYGLALAVTPFVLGRLGFYDFGLWAITGALAQYASLFDLGVTRSVTRFVALYRAQDDHRAAAEVTGTAALVVVALTLGLGGLAVAGAGPAGDVLGFRSTATARVVLVCAVVLVGSSLLGRAVAAASFGRGRMVNGNIGITVMNVLTLVGGVGVLAVVDSLEGYAIGTAAGGLAGAAALSVTVGVRDGELPFARPSPARAAADRVRHQEPAVRHLGPRDDADRQDHHRHRRRACGRRGVRARQPHRDRRPGARDPGLDGADA